MSDQPAGDCQRCGHDFMPHPMIATTEGDPTHGGIILCQVLGCTCLGTWALGRQLRESVRLPTDVELIELREFAQGA